MLLRTSLVSFAQIQQRHYSKATRKILSKRISVLAQDTEKFPEYKFSRSKPTDRRIYAWGFAATGALGIEQSLKKLAQRNAHIMKHPARQSFAERRQVIDCASGYGFSLFACKREGDNISLFGTGLNTDSQIGFHKLGGATNKPMEQMIYPAPIFLPKANEDEDIQIVKCAAGRAHSVVLSDAGIMYTMGNNAFGQCGRTIVDGEQFAASQLIHRIDGNALSDGAKVKDIVCGQDHTLVVLDDGKVLSCGWGADGQTGLGHYNSADTLTRVGGDILNEKIVKVASNTDCVLALNDKGEVFGWGNSEYGQLEIKDDMQQIHTPIHLKALSAYGKIIDIATGGSYCLVLNENHQVIVWGYGILGVGPNVDYAKEPVIIPTQLFGRNEFNPDSQVMAVYSGNSHMGVVTNTHDVYMWGRNRNGCLGFGHQNDQYFPFKVAIGALCLKISCGVDHTLAFCKAHM